MSSFFDTIVEILKQDERFFTAEGELLRNAVYETAMQMDAKLIKYDKSLCGITEKMGMQDT